MILEALRRPHLLSQTHEEVFTSQSSSCLPSSPSLDIDSLCSMPLLQSMYAETLRVYTSLFALRSAAHEDFKIGNFSIPKDELIAVDSRVAAMNKAIWNTGPTTTAPEGVHPLDVFWAERFLVYPNDPTSGPFRFDPSTLKGPPSPDASYRPTGNRLRFTMDGLAGAWLPFGGGSRQCPGRNFAKQEIITSSALVSSMLEIELLDSTSVDSRRPNIKYYGLGTLPPKGKVPFRIRKRG